VCSSDLALDNAKVFLHATINEHWGVAVAEAMARGLPVVIHKSGGAWSDLAMSGEVGLGYDTADEAVESIARLLTDGKEWAYRSWKSTERVSELDFNRWIKHVEDRVVRKLWG
jgi:glycosyltransferase involved in cell wall biosynthesis